MVFSDSNMPVYKLVYFDSRARGEVARLLFTLANVEFTDKRIEYGSEEWQALKPGKCFINMIVC